VAQATKQVIAALGLEKEKIVIIEHPAGAETELHQEIDHRHPQVEDHRLEIDIDLQHPDIATGGAVTVEKTIDHNHETLT
jgi:hypothetical protein